MAKVLKKIIRIALQSPQNPIQQRSVYVMVHSCESIKLVSLDVSLFMSLYQGNNSCYLIIVT